MRKVVKKVIMILIEIDFIIGVLPYRIKLEQIYLNGYPSESMR